MELTRLLIIILCFGLAAPAQTALANPAKVADLADDFRKAANAATKTSRAVPLAQRTRDIIALQKSKPFASAKPVVESKRVYNHNFMYSERVSLRAAQDRVSHNFPYSFDDAILASQPIRKANGYRLYQLNGSMNGKYGVFEIGLNKYNIIDHRFFRPIRGKN